MNLVLVVCCSFVLSLAISLIVNTDKTEVLKSKETGPRLLILFLTAVGTLATWIFIRKMDWVAYLLVDLKISSWLLISLPTATVLWSFRNTDKRIDQKQYYLSIEKENLLRLIDIYITDITELKEKKFDVLCIGPILDGEERVQLGMFSFLKFYGLNYELVNESEYKLALKKLNKSYLKLINVLLKFEDSTKSDELSKHYAEQNMPLPPNEFDLKILDFFNKKLSM